ncbi:MAG: integrase [Proteobacteria bacterium]|nr:MAG: integrase [Pseudomonadota bacterium]
MNPDFESYLLQKHQFTQEFIVEIYLSESWDILNKLPISSDSSGEIVSYYGDEIWDLSAYTNNQLNETKTKYSFSKFENNTLLNEQKLIAYSWLNFTGGRTIGYKLKITSLVTQQKILNLIYLYLDNLGLNSIAELGDENEFYKFCEYLKDKKLAFGSVQHYLGILANVIRLKNIIPVCLTINSSKSFRSLARKLASDEKQTVNQYYSIPTNIMEKIYGKAISVIELCYPIKEELNDLLCLLRENYLEGKHIVDRKIDDGEWIWLTKKSTQYKTEVNKKIPIKDKEVIKEFVTKHKLESSDVFSSLNIRNIFSIIQTASYILCGAFSGMRKSELFHIKTDGFVKRIENKQTYYSIQSKTIKFIKGKTSQEEWLASPVCKKAIDVAEAITRNMREQLCKSNNIKNREKAQCLWLSQAIKSRTPNIRGSSSLKNILKNFSKFSEAVITDKDVSEFKIINPNSNEHIANEIIKSGVIWPLSTHQFRRTYAVFAKRHSLCTDMAIKQQFKHILLPMSQWYGEGGLQAQIKNIRVDEELYKLIADVNNELITNKLFSWYTSKEKLAGKKGVEIMNSRNDLSAKYGSWETVNKLIKEGRLSLTGTLHSYCMANYECTMEKTVNPANCFGCNNLVVDEEKAISWKKRHEWIIDSINKLKNNASLTSSTFSHFITQIKAAEQIMAEFDIEFTPYDESTVKI